MRGLSAVRDHLFPILHTAKIKGRDIFRGVTVTMTQSRITVRIVSSSGADSLVHSSAR